MFPNAPKQSRADRRDLDGDSWGVGETAIVYEVPLAPLNQPFTNDTGNVDDKNTPGLPLDAQTNVHREGDTPDPETDAAHETVDSLVDTIQTSQREVENTDSNKPQVEDGETSIEAKAESSHKSIPTQNTEINEPSSCSLRVSGSWREKAKDLLPIDHSEPLELPPVLTEMSLVHSVSYADTKEEAQVLPGPPSKPSGSSQRNRGGASGGRGARLAKAHEKRRPLPSKLSRNSTKKNNHKDRNVNRDKEDNRQEEENDDDGDDDGGEVILYARTPSQRAAASRTNESKVISSPEFPLRSPEKILRKSLETNKSGAIDATLKSTKKKKRRKKPRGSPFERLYRKGKEREMRMKLREQLHKNSPPPECTFSPMTTAVENAMSPMKPAEMVRSLLDAVIGSIESVGSQLKGRNHDRTLLATEYRSRVADYATQRLNAARHDARRKGEDTFESLYKEAELRNKSIKEREELQKKKTPVDCTFQPNLNRLNKKYGGKKQQEPPRYISLYAKKKAERDQARAQLKRRLKEKEDQFGMAALEAAMAQEKRENKTEKKDSEADSISEESSAITPRETRKGIDSNGRFIKFDKVKHREKMETLDFLRQKSHCTFRPTLLRNRNIWTKADRLPKAAKGAPSKLENKGVVERLLKDGEMRRERDIKKLSNTRHT